MTRKFSLLNMVCLSAGLVFLYLPIVVLVVYSFNESRLASVWTGFSLKWYWELLNDQAMLSAAWLTLKLGALSATTAMILGTMAAIALVRFGRFGGRTFLSILILSTVLLPEVIVGLSLILFFVALDFQRGFWTLYLSHTTFTLCFVALTVQARIHLLDRCYEEAAADLGCSPLRTFFRVTLPLIWPSVFAGWLLAFTISIDDVVISSFTNGPGYTTLPIEIWSSIKRGITPKINAACSILIFITVVGTVVFSLYSRPDRARRFDT